MQHLGPYDTVTLQEITARSVGGICLLSETLRAPQKYAVAPNAYSLAQAHFYPQAWYRAVFAGKAPVGFIMLSDEPEKPEYFLWRFMIAPHFQGRGYGRAAIERLVDYVRTRPGATELLVSCILGEGSPAGFYEQVGFVSTGEMEGVELILKMARRGTACRAQSAPMGCRGRGMPTACRAHGVPCPGRAVPGACGQGTPCPIRAHGVGRPRGAGKARLAQSAPTAWGVHRVRARHALPNPRPRRGASTGCGQGTPCPYVADE